ncbi:MAG TPA: triose-phosphate isomerase [Ignavibacteriaceae bacterium]
MRKNVIAGNWKMNNDLSESQNLITRLTSGLSNLKINCDVIICPPYTSLSEANSLIKNTIVKLGAQNVYHEDNGAYTGEISPLMLKSVGCEYVIIGHSERRTIFKESNETINKKIKKALEHGLKVIFCIGETLDEREKNITNDVVKKQVIEGLLDMDEKAISNMIIAYEPVWAIGTGRNATPQQAQDVHKFIRKLIEDKYSSGIADDLTIQYGGSVKPDNARELLSQPDIDGALVGGACLKAESFIDIIKAA